MSSSGRRKGESSSKGKTKKAKKTFTKEDVIDSFKIKYKVGERIDGRTFDAMILRVDEGNWYDATIQLYRTEEDARHIYQIATDAPSNYHIIRAYWLDLPKNGYPIIVFEKFYPFTFESWLSQVINPWIMDKGQVIFGGEAFTTAFTGIRKGLQALHYNAKYHGHVADGIRISKNNLVQLVNFKPKATLEQAMVQDLSDFRSLVDDFCSKHRGADTWEGVTLFRELDKFFHGRPNFPRAVGLLSHYAFFTYHAPLFYKAMDVNRLVLKMLEFRRMNANSFDQDVALTSGLTDIGDWRNIVMVHPQFRRTFYHGVKLKVGIPDRYEDIETVHKFLQNTRTHLARGTITACDVVVMFHKCFPGFIHKLYHRFVTQIGVTGSFQGRGVIPCFQEGVACFY